MPAFVFGTKIS
jgi:hypothetical protein